MNDQWANNLPCWMWDAAYWHVQLCFWRDWQRQHGLTPTWEGDAE